MSILLFIYVSNSINVIYMYMHNFFKVRLCTAQTIHIYSTAKLYH